MGRKIVPIEASITRDKNGCFLTMKSEIIEEEAKRYSAGTDGPNRYHVPRRSYDQNFLFNVSANDLGGEEIWYALRTIGLKDGITVKMDRPASPEVLNNIAKTLGEFVKSHIVNHLAAVRVTLRVECDEAMIRWKPVKSDGPTTEGGE